MKGKVDTVVGEAILWVVVGTDAFGSVSCTDLGTAVFCVFFTFFIFFDLKESGAEDGHGADTVFMLGSIVSAVDEGTGGFVNDLDGTVGGIDGLTTWT